MLRQPARMHTHTCTNSPTCTPNAAVVSLPVTSHCLTACGVNPPPPHAHAHAPTRTITHTHAHTHLERHQCCQQLQQAQWPGALGSTAVRSYGKGLLEHPRPLRRQGCHRLGADTSPEKAAHRAIHLAQPGTAAACMAPTSPRGASLPKHTASSKDGTRSLHGPTCQARYHF